MPVLKNNTLLDVIEDRKASIEKKMQEGHAFWQTAVNDQRALLKTHINGIKIKD